MIIFKMAWERVNNLLYNVMLFLAYSAIDLMHLAIQTKEQLEIFYFRIVFRIWAQHAVHKLSFR